MILSGEKKEEYIKIKPYWDKRLHKKYDVVCFSTGYKKDSPRLTAVLKEVVFGFGTQKWGATDEICYVLKLGKIVKTIKKGVKNG